MGRRDGAIVRGCHRTVAGRWEGPFSVTFSVKGTDNDTFSGYMADKVHVLLTFTLTVIPLLFSVSAGPETAGTRVGMGRGWTVQLGLGLDGGSGHLFIGSAFIEDEDAGRSRQQGF